MADIKKFYMVGNAHLDPIWLWHWQEGSAEAKATIRSALDRMKENPDFKFVCSSASVYEWIEEFDPEMFEEIKERVKTGQFGVVGGWYTQPDCNLPSGEGFARQSLYSQRFFKEKLGVTAKVGYNVDSFGHNIGLPQILKKSGMDSYIYMRPGIKENTKIKDNLFNWQSPDGSTVKTYHITDGYGYFMDDDEDFAKRLETVAGECTTSGDKALFFYGIGNHGGGPSKLNIKLIHERQKAHPETELIFSNLNDFFDTFDSKDLPTVTEEPQHHASGCYAAVSKIKSEVRRCENELCAAEAFSVMGNILLGKKYDTIGLKKAWNDVCFLHFHDVFSGTAVESAYEGCFQMSGEARIIAARAQNNALQSISWAIDTSDSEKGIPIILFNPNAWDFDGLVQINRHVPQITDEDGNVLAQQLVFSEAHNTCARKDTVFNAHIPALGYSVYYYPSNETRAMFTFNGGNSADNEGLKAEDNVIENEHLRVTFDKHNGFIASLFDKDNECELLSGDGAVPAVIDEYAHDTWSHDLYIFENEIGKFSDAKVYVTENGPLRVTMRVESKYGSSKLTQDFTLVTGKKQLDVKAKLDWDEKHKMLKIRFPVNATNPKSLYEIPFGIITRDCNKEEYPGLNWVALQGEERTVALLNNNKYSFSFNENIMNLTVVRSPIYADHGWPSRIPESHFTDQGISTFNYSVLPVENGIEKVVRAAKELNIAPTVIIENSHKGTLPRTMCGLKCNCENVNVSAFKRAEDGKGLVLRAYETAGKTAKATFDGDLLATPLCVDFTPFSAKTFYLSDETKEWREVLMTEYDF